MKEFKMDYDKENDDLLMYLDGTESFGGVELGDLIVDFDKKGNLVGMEILNASVFFSKAISNLIEITKIKTVEIEIVNFRNMSALQMKINMPNQTYRYTVLIPRISQSSPALMT